MTNISTTAEAAGLARVRQIIASPQSQRGIGVTLRIAPLEAEPGTVILRGTATQDHTNPYGTVHGGYVATMVDGAMALAVLTMLDADFDSVTTDLRVSFLRPLGAASDPVRCEGLVLHRGRACALAEARVINPDGRLVAHATGTFAIIRV